MTRSLQYWGRTSIESFSVEAVEDRSGLPPTATSVAKPWMVNCQCKCDNISTLLTLSTLSTFQLLPGQIWLISLPMINWHLRGRCQWRGGHCDSKPLTFPQEHGMPHLTWSRPEGEQIPSYKSHFYNLHSTCICTIICIHFLKSADLNLDTVGIPRSEDGLHQFCQLGPVPRRCFETVHQILIQSDIRYSRTLWSKMVKPVIKNGKGKW